MALFDCKKLKYKHLYRDLQHFLPFSNIDYQEVINSESLVNNDILNSYVGKYLFEKEPMSIVKEGGQLFVLVNNIKMQMWFTSETEFFNLEQRANTRFTKDAQGKVNGFVYTEEGFETTAKKIE